MNNLITPINTTLPFYRVVENYDPLNPTIKPFYFQKQQCQNDCFFGTITDHNQLPSYIIEIPRNYGVNHLTEFEVKTMCADGTTQNLVEIKDIHEDFKALDVISEATMDILDQANSPSIGDKYFVFLEVGKYQVITWIVSNEWEILPDLFIPKKGDFIFLSVIDFYYIWIENDDSSKFVLTNKMYQIYDVGDKTYFIYNGMPVEELACGFIQLIVNFDLPNINESKKFISELIKVEQFDILNNEYHKLEVANSCNLGNIPYSETCFSQIYYFDKRVVVGVPKPNIEDSKEEDGLGNSIIVFSRISKTFTIDTYYVPEYISDFITFATQNDLVYIYYPNFEQEDVILNNPYKGIRKIDSNSMEVKTTWENSGCYAQVQLLITLVDSTIKTSCCQQLNEQGCLVCDRNILGLKLINEQSEVENSNLEVGDSYIINQNGTPNADPQDWNNYPFNIAVWNGSGWDFEAPILNDTCVSIGDVDYIFSGNGKWGQVSSVNATLTFSDVSTTEYVIEAFVHKTYFGHLYRKHQQTNVWIFMGQFTPEEFNFGVDVIFPTIPGGVNFQIRMLNNNCDYSNGLIL